jgi:hypothetical protein
MAEEPPKAASVEMPDTTALQAQLARLWLQVPVETPDADGRGDASEHEADRRRAGQHEFPFGLNTTGPYGGERR